QPFGYLIPIIVFLGLQAFAVRAEYLAGPGAVWNPARHYLYWGVGLASAGCFGSLMLIELGVLAFIVLD
ncbi:MAG: hypothetical protein M1608_18395, partial [Candidatus Omnitrophica bacterium]|nr:hypothetical protein [Candidatus Omnitrophota bacterium]